MAITNEMYENYILSRWEYAIGVEPRMSDMEYNEFHAMMLKEMPDNEYVKRTWSEDPCPVELLRKYHRLDLYRDIKIKFGSESIGSLRSMDEVEAMFKNLNKKTRVSLKCDGWNTQTNYYNGGVISANTRGRETNAIEANVITDVVPQKIPLGKRVKVIGEALIPNDRWKDFQLLTGNTGQRHSVSTILANNQAGYVKVMAFNIVSTDVEVPEDKYAALKEWGFETPMYVWVSNYDQLLNAIKMLGSMKDRVNYETDGLVVENADVQIALRVGAWQEEDLLSYVTGYTQSPTPYGFSMTLNVKPIKVNGVTISNPNITNINQIVKNNLKIGSPVAFVMRSGANPVVNLTKTLMLQEEYEDRYDEYRERVDKSVVS